MFEPHVDRLNPEFNQVFEWNGSMEDLFASPLRLSVYDHDWMRKDTPLGEVALEPIVSNGRPDERLTAALQLSTHGTIRIRYHWFRLLPSDTVQEVDLSSVRSADARENRTSSQVGYSS